MSVHELDPDRALDEVDPHELHAPHPYICERCGNDVVLTLIEFWRQSGSRGQFKCERCRAEIAAEKARGL